MIDFTVPDELKGILDGRRRFVALEVVPLEKQHAATLDNPRKLYDEKGLLVPAILEARRQIRAKSAAAGHHSMFVPQGLGRRRAGRARRLLRLGVSVQGAGANEPAGRGSARPPFRRGPLARLRAC